MLRLPRTPAGLLAHPPAGLVLLGAAGGLFLLMAASGASLRRLLRLRDET